MASAAQEVRCERKFLIDRIGPREVLAVLRLHPSLFREAYPPRQVNNLYFDTLLLDSYEDNLEGVGEREKVRLRWYGSFFGPVDQPALEVKARRGMVGSKARFPLLPFEVYPDLPLADLYEAIRLSHRVPPLLWERLRGQRPSLASSYQRAYFVTPDGLFRATVDCDLTFFHTGPVRLGLTHHRRDYRNVVLEIKYPPELEARASRIISWLPFRVTRSSKYAQGIECLLLA